MDYQSILVGYPIRPRTTQVREMSMASQILDDAGRPPLKEGTVGDVSPSLFSLLIGIFTDPAYRFRYRSTGPVAVVRGWLWEFDQQEFESIRTYSCIMDKEKWFRHWRVLVAQYCTRITTFPKDRFWAWRGNVKCSGETLKCDMSIPS